MKIMTYVDIHSTAEAFLGNRLARLVDLIVEQGDDLLHQAGLSFPARASSALLLIEEYEKLSTADIARLLGQPHQLVTQRVDLLIAQGLVKRKADKSDARRKILALTARGRDETVILHACLKRAEQVYTDLYSEIEANLSQITQRAIIALVDKPLKDRFGFDWAASAHQDGEGQQENNSKMEKSSCVLR